MHQDESRHNTARTTQATPSAMRSTHGNPSGAVEDATGQTVRNGAISMLVAAAVLLACNSAGLRTWAHGLPGNAVTDVLVEGADAWHSMMTRAGVATAAAVIRDAVAGLRDQPWTGPGILSPSHSRASE